MIESTAILGAGSWGTALAALWAQDGRDIVLWGHNAERIARSKASRENSDYLPGVQLQGNIRLTSDIADCAGSGLVVFVVPSKAFRQIAQLLAQTNLAKGAVLLSCTKGIEHGTGLRMTEILSEILPGHEVAVLSGPNLAVEVARQLPTLTVLGCHNMECVSDLQSFLSGPRFRVYSSDEVTGIELGGALKNVFALPAGISDGLGLGDLAELVRLGTAMGGSLRTFYGLSGAGDLIATCFSRHSRNRQVGERIGHGESVAQITSSMQMVAEGIPTAKSAYDCARQLKVETPIIDQVYAMVYEGKTPLESLKALMQRDQKAEVL
jgi:glycerol-3-phosphate dehydrogenase (NAD(P)+)